jgi:hypothetical protein
MNLIQKKWLKEALFQTKKFSNSNSVKCNHGIWA